jgi:hypothetical protein
MHIVVSEPTTRLTVDLAALEVNAGAYRFPITLPAAAREAFLEGTWDATALLLDRFEDVEAVARNLPYVNGF